MMKNTLKVISTFIIVLVLFNPLSLQIYYHIIKNKLSSNNINEEVYVDIQSNGEEVDDNYVKRLDKSTIKGEEYNFDTKYYPYFGMLNENEKKLYKQIYANSEKIVESFSPYIDVNIDEVKNTFEALYNDHPELFWVNTSYSYKYTESKKCVEIILSYNDTSKDIEKSKKIFDNQVNTIISNAKKYKTDYEKEKYVHDYLVKNVKYDKNSTMNQSAYSALINKKTICAGYSRAFQYIMIKLNIPTYYVVGVANVNHAWNIVKLSDGYYNVDLTWDSSDNNKYNYFNKTDKYFSSSHKRVGLSLKLPSCNATTYTVNNKVSNKISNVSNISKTSNTKSNVNVIIIKSNILKSNSLESNSNSNKTISNSNSNKEKRKHRRSNINIVSNINIESNIIKEVLDENEEVDINENNDQ